MPVFEKRLKPFWYGLKPRSLRNFVAMPIVPDVAMKANASGMPAKLAATPQKVARTVRTTRGVPSRTAAYAIRKPSEAARERGDEAHLDRVLEGAGVRLVEDLAHVCGREPAVERLEGADQHLRGGQEQEKHGVGQEGNDAEPDESRTNAAAGFHRPRRLRRFERRAQGATRRPSSAIPSRSAWRPGRFGSGSRSAPSRTRTGPAGP